MVETDMLLRLGDYFFMIFHSLLILFNLFAWLYKPLLKWHLTVLSLTFASWGILGVWYGFGYCPFTDWHFDILKNLGVKDLPKSYISYLLQRVFNIHLAYDVVDGLTLGCTIVALTLSVYLNFLGKKSKDQ